MKKFLFKAILLFCPVLMFLIYTNYFGDAARLFNNDYEKKMVDIIKKGNYVTNVENYDERLFQREIIKQSFFHPDIAIFGSSRTMLINSNLFPDSSLFNNSVSGASMEDIIGIYQIFKVNNKLPKKIIVGIDPWMFNEVKEKGRWVTIGDYYYQFIGKKNEGNDVNYKYKELISLSYFQNSLKLLPSLIVGKSEPYGTLNKYNETGTRLTDGSRVYGNTYRTASQREIDEKVQSYISKKEIYGLKGLTSVSKKRWDEFELLIADIQNNNIELIIFLSPYAPLAYQNIIDRYPIVSVIEQNLKSFSAKKNIKVIGSFNPLNVGLDKTFFYDGMHVKEDGVIKLFN
jgi:hypothetical protein